MQQQTLIGIGAAPRGYCDRCLDDPQIKVCVVCGKGETPQEKRDGDIRGALNEISEISWSAGMPMRVGKEIRRQVAILRAALEVA